MREQVVSIICRAEDHQLVEAALPWAAEQYRQLSGITPQATVETRHRLAPGKSSAGRGPSW